MKPVRILFVCLGNICRSPLAEGVMRHMAGDRPIQVDSAGTGSWHIGDPPDRRSIAVASKHGIDISAQRGRTFGRSDFDDFDLILAMDHDNLAKLEAIMPAKARARVHLFMAYILGQATDVPDPYYEGPEGFERVYSMLSEGCSSLVAKLEEIGS